MGERELAAKPPNECRPEGQVFSDLMERRGLFQLAKVREEMATEVPFFAAIASGTGERGVKLG